MIQIQFYRPLDVSPQHKLLLQLVQVYNGVNDNAFSIKNRQKLLKLRLGQTPTSLLRMPSVSFDGLNFCDVLKIIRERDFNPLSVFSNLYHFLVLLICLCSDDLQGGAA